MTSSNTTSLLKHYSDSFEHLDAAGCFDYLYTAGYYPNTLEEALEAHKKYLATAPEPEVSYIPASIY